jgi:hypothetical protein
LPIASDVQHPAAKRRQHLKEKEKNGVCMRSGEIQAESMAFYAIPPLHITLSKKPGNAIRVRQFF